MKSFSIVVICYAILVHVKVVGQISNFHSKLALSEGNENELKNFARARSLPSADSSAEYDHSREIPREPLYCVQAGDPLSGPDRKLIRVPVGEHRPWSNVCWKATGRRVTRTCYYNWNRRQPQLEPIPNGSTAECQNCETESFRHALGAGHGNDELIENSWNSVRVGEYGGLHVPCLQPNGLPLVRKCLYNSTTQRAQWESIGHWPTIRCVGQNRETLVYEDLNILHRELAQGKHLNNGTEGRLLVTDKLCDLLMTPERRIVPADIFVTSQILRTMADEIKDPELAAEVVSICDTLLSSDPQVLRQSAVLNSSNSLLETFETFMDGSSETLMEQQCGVVSKKNFGGRRQRANVESIDYSSLGVRVHISTDVSVFYVNPGCANITGIAVYERRVHSSLMRLHYSRRDLHFRFIYMNQTVDTLMLEPGLQAATYLPTSLWQHVKETLQQTARQQLIVFKLYAHDGLFVELSPVTMRKPFSKILSISIPGYSVEFPEKLPFILRNQRSSESCEDSVKTGTGCGYWNYSTWTSHGVLTNSCRNSVVLCGTTHLTQFAYLVGGTYRNHDLSSDLFFTPVYLKTLDIISLVGCSLSLFGLFGIWLTAALFSNWRSLSSTKVLLNLCVALTLQMILFVCVNTDGVSEYLVRRRMTGSCIAIGALLQYAVLVHFTWMLIVAILQFQRYVTVIGFERPRHYILKSAIAAWGFPLIPTLLVVVIDPNSYIPTNFQLRTDTGICYPSGHGLMFGIILPVSLIIIANLTVFVCVFHSISHSLSQPLQRSEKQMLNKQVRLYVLLFFLLGLSWIFGLFAFMQAGIVFSFLFCLTATLQGFVLFVYFVLLDETVRSSWKRLLSRKQTAKKPTEMQSMSTDSTDVQST